MSEIAKREKARRVWRLNKKEGIPVLEALETVDISKDVYYRIKDKHEEKWEEEILTVEQIQNRLSEADERLETLENRIEQMEDRFQNLRSEFASLEIDMQAVEEANDLSRKIERMESTLEDVTAALDVEYGRAPNRLKYVQKRVEELEELDIADRLEEVEREAGNAMKAAESAEHQAQKAREEAVTSWMDLW